MPSYVAFDEENPKCGQIVINRMWYKFQHSIEKYQNSKLTHAIITIPSQFTDKQKHSLKTAAELAGWLNITFLPEPIAAAFAYFSEIDIPNNSNVFICDIGGGTVDICIAKICENKLKILNFDGDSYLGGRDFDYILYTHFKGILQHKFGFDITKSLKKYDLKQKCQEIKHTLSVTEEYWINVDEFVFNVDERIKITKAEFEEMSLPLILRIKNVILRVLENGNILKNEINFVFQVGGGCRMPLIKQLLKDIFPNSNHQCSLYPDWVVAHGAALYAYSLQTNKRGKIYENLHSESEVYTIPKQPSNYNPELNAVGIDFGTTECSAAVIRKNGPDLVILDMVTNLRTTPSYVAFDEEDPKCGQIVVNRMRYWSKYSVFDVKRIMGKNIDEIIIDPLWPFKVIKGKESVFIEVETFAAKETKSGEEISSVLLNHIKKQIEEYQASNLTDAVITVPSKFTDKQKHSLKTAAELAGLSNVIFLPEPIAAAFAYFTELNILNNANIFVCDFGGGTVDICVAKVINDELKILNSDGDSYLGGRDFDNVLFTYFNGILKHKFNFDVTKDSKKYVLKQKCQGIKHALSTDEADWMYVDDFDRTIDETIRITRIEFEEMSLPLVLKVKSVIFRALKNSNLAKNDINYVFQVGGGCRMPMIKKLLVEVFPDSIHHCSLNPDWAVAHGAALYAYNLKTNKEENETTVIDPNQAPSWLTNYFEVL
uniref:Uncharacterized protein n=1 Tax=Panagrolaimus davidi TaxID=227884 RepID=A0A914QSX7_9BILA